MEVEVELEVENVIDGTTRRGASGMFTMVAVDENWHPAPVPPWKPETEAELEKWHQVEKRRREK
jgi:acyl-CoA thioesterase YciA